MANLQQLVITMCAIGILAGVLTGYNDVEQNKVTLFGIHSEKNQFYDTFKQDCIYDTSAQQTDQSDLGKTVCKPALSGKMVLTIASSAVLRIPPTDGSLDSVSLIFGVMMMVVQAFTAILLIFKIFMVTIKGIDS